MAIDNSFMIKRFEKFKELFVLYTGGGDVPFVECDEVTFDDQVYVFTSQEDLQRYAQIYTKEKYLLKGVNFPQAQFGRLYEQLYCMGIDTLQVVDGGAPVTVKLSELAEPPVYDKLPAENMPASNPGLQLSASYFLQELKRPVERDTKEKKRLRELEEEMAVNLLRSKFIMVFEVLKRSEKRAPGDKRSIWRVPLVKNKAGKAYQPIYTDFFEFRKTFERNRGARLGINIIGYDELERVLSEGAEGFVFNPAGFNLILNKKQIGEMKKRYGGRA